MKILDIQKNDAGQRLDKFLLKTLKTLPLPLLYKDIRKKKIKVNRKRAEPGQILREGDTVQLFLPEEFFAETASEQAFLHLTPRLNILFEDENILLLEKKPGMIVHADDDQVSDTLIDHVKAYLFRKGEYNPASEQSFVPALCNRIDRNTGGIVIAAKNAEALRMMNEKIRLNQVQKRYLLAVHGKMKPKQGRLHSWLVKNSQDNRVQVFRSRPASALAKECITDYRVLCEKTDAELGDLSLVEAELHTGRTHQIRAQFSDAGHPLLGDGKYGINRDAKRSGYKFQALYAYRIGFPFQEPSGCLESLSGKEFQASPQQIWFLKEFPQFRT